MSSDCRISADASLISDSRAISNKSRRPAFHPGRAVYARAVSHRPPSLLASPGSGLSDEPGSVLAWISTILPPLLGTECSPPFADTDVVDVTLALTDCLRIVGLDLAESSPAGSHLPSR